VEALANARSFDDSKGDVVNALRRTRQGDTFLGPSQASGPAKVFVSENKKTIRLTYRISTSGRNADEGTPKPRPQGEVLPRERGTGEQRRHEVGSEWRTAVSHNSAGTYE